MTWLELMERIAELPYECQDEQVLIVDESEGTQFELGSVVVAKSNDKNSVKVGRAYLI